MPLSGAFPATSDTIRLPNWGRTIAREPATTTRFVRFDLIGIGLLSVSVALAVGLASRGLIHGAVALVVWGLLGYGVLVAISHPRAVRVLPQPPSHDSSDDETPPLPAPPVPVEPDLELKAYVQLVEQALRNLNRSTTLSHSPLIAQLPRTLAAARLGRFGTADASTPLVQAQLLRDVLVAGIERLSSGDPTAGIGQTVEYRILNAEYVLGWSTAAIRVKESISESTFHRYRGKAILALAEDLRHHEQALRDRRAGASDPVALDYLG